MSHVMSYVTCMNKSCPESFYVYEDEPKLYTLEHACAHLDFTHGACA